ncbi:hypothetical protein PQX77_020195 [Marasmius sp. AFHP31]|nr:hypothetical protein PQX77_020195 [Marasmius sp. AFHP31]
MVTVLSWARGTKTSDTKKAHLFDEAYPDANLKTGNGLPPGTCTPCPSGRTHFLNIAVTTKPGFREKVGTLTYCCKECQSGRGNVWYGTRFPYARADELAGVVESWVANQSRQKELERDHEKEMKAAMKASKKEFVASQKEEMKAIRAAEKVKKRAEKATKGNKSAVSGRHKGKMREILSSPVRPSTPIAKNRALPESAPATICCSSTFRATDFDDHDSDSDLPELSDVLAYWKKTSEQTTPVASSSKTRLPHVAGGTKKRAQESEGSSSSLVTPVKRPKVCLEFDSDEGYIEYQLPDTDDK